MESNSLLMIVVAILSMFFGYFFGLFEGRGQGYKKRKQEEEAEKATSPSEAETQPPSPPPPAAHPLPQPEPSLLRLSRDANGQLRLELDNVQVNTTALSVNERRRLIELLNLMRPWLVSEQPAPAPRPTAAPASPPPPAAVPAPSRPVAPPPPTAAPTAPKSIVEQIDAILQERIAGTPLESRGIRLLEAPDGSVTVLVGLNRYQGIAEVPDEDIRAAIRSATEEWERKYTPG